RGNFEKRASVSAGIKDGLLRIAVRDTDPKMAADIANGYVEEFHKLSSSLAITEASQRRLFFQQQLSDAAGNLASAEDAMKHTQQTTGVLEIDSQAKSLIESAAMLRAQVTAKQVQIQGLSSYATDNNPEMVTAHRQLAELQAQLAKLGGSEQDLDPLVVPKGKAPEASMEYIKSYREMKFNETLYDLIAKQFEVAKLDEARQGVIIQVADRATPPDKKSGPHRFVILLLFFVMGFVLSCALVLARNAWTSVTQDGEKSAKLAALKQGLFGRK
ncbi:MAG: GNVR domain-containing protein, partial [Terracidiphilus sp.]